MSHKLLALPCSFLAVALTGCATLFGGGSNQTISFQSSPPSANFTVTASSGLQMYQGKTPAQVSLPRKHEYRVEISLEGYRPQTVVLTKALNGWTWVNLLSLSWLLGFGIDFLTGAAYKLEPALVNVTLERVEGELVALVRLLNRDHRVLEEHRVRMVPE